jgi:Peptidase family S41/Tricorn protease C1 domain
MRPALSVTMLALLALLLPACASAPDRQSSTDSGTGGDSDTTSTAPQPTEVWRSDGYNLIIGVAGSKALTYETTTISCLPSNSLDQLGQAAADGTVQYGRKGVPAATLRRGTDGRATLHLLGTAADIDLLPMSGLPGPCTKKMPSDPLTTFDVFWATFAENYNSFGRKNIDWNAVRDQYRPKVSSDTEDDDLFAVLRAMIKPLGDVHTTISADGKEFDGLRPGTPDLSDKGVRKAVDDHLREDLGVSQIQSFANKAISYADLPGGRGYLRIDGFEGYNDEDSSFTGSKATLAQVLDQVFTQQRVSTLKGLVIDVRNNSGGDDALGLQVAGRLTNTPYTAFTKQPRNDPKDQSKHARLQTVTVTPATGPRYTGPIRVLTSSLTISAGETFVEALMGRTPAPSRLGASTQGVFADDMTRKLPNGWTFTLGNEDYYAPDGHNYEGVGIPPTVPIPVFSPDDLEQHHDAALDAPW